MSEFKFQCLMCGQNIVCQANQAGERVACPNCKNTITVPRGFDEPTKSEPAPAGPPPLPPIPLQITKRTSALALASLVCSLSSLITCIGWLPGIICGHLAKSKIRRDPSLDGSGLATAGLTIGYAILILTVSSAGIGRLFFEDKIKQAYQQAQQEMAAKNFVSPTGAPILADDSGTNNNGVTNNTPMAVADQPGWTLDVKDATFPDSPVSGTLHGADFTGKKIIYRNGNIRINSTVAGESLVIHGLGAALANSSYEFQPATDTNAPVIEITWSDGGESQRETFTNGYVMKLQFAKAVKRKVRAQIYLCLPDDSKSYVAGNFAVVLPKRKP